MSWWDTLVDVGSEAIDLYQDNKDWIDPAVNLGVGYYTGNKAEDIAERSSAEQRQNAQIAYERSLPWNTGGLFGAAVFDPETQTSLQTLSPELRAQYDAYLNRSGTHTERIPAARAEFDRNKALGRAQEGVYDTEMARTAGAQADYSKQMGYASDLEGDVFGAGKKFYEQQKALYAPEQEKARLSQEARLLSQGRLGSTGGAGEMEALRTAQGQVDLEAQYAGLDKAQQQVNTFRNRGQDALSTEGIYRGNAAVADQRVGMFNARANEGQALEDVYRGRQASDLAMVQSLGQLPSGYAQTGRGIGTGMSSIADTAASMQNTASKGMADTSAAKYSGLASTIGGYLNPKK